jgi:hypothetical protein
MHALVSEATKVSGVNLFVESLLEPITGAKKWSLALDVLQLFTTFDRSWYLTYAGETINTALQKEAMEC